MVEKISKWLHRTLYRLLGYDLCIQCRDPIHVDNGQKPWCTVCWAEARWMHEGPPDCWGKSMTESLKPCPWCQGIDVFIASISDDSDRFVECNTCFANGPMGKSDEEAARIWNTRTSEREAIAEWLEQQGGYHMHMTDNIAYARQNAFWEAAVGIRAGRFEGGESG